MARLRSSDASMVSIHWKILILYVEWFLMRYSRKQLVMTDNVFKKPSVTW